MDRTIMPKKRYTPEEIIQHLRTVELDIGEAKVMTDRWRTHYNTVRPQSSLGGQPPDTLQLVR
jgi:transposase InsO family protein